MTASPARLPHHATTRTRPEENPMTDTTANPLTDQQFAELEELIGRTTPVGALTASPGLLGMLVAEVRRLRAELANAPRPHTPRLCQCGHSYLAHTVPAPHSCFAHGQTCPCQAYQQLPHDEAVAQLKRNQQAAAERAAAAAPDPVCGDENDGDWCELEPGHEGHHSADTVEWAR